jgi:alpha-tubulin suppressor-like RCC1 family protein
MCSEFRLSISCKIVSLQLWASIRYLLLLLALMQLLLACGEAESNGWHLAEDATVEVGSDAGEQWRNRDHIVAVEAGTRTCLLYSDGLIECAGTAAGGGRGIWSGDRGDRSGALVQIPSVSDAVSLSSPGIHGCALLPQGRITCWGKNSSFQMTDAAGRWDGEPVVIPEIDDAVAVAAGGAHSCALHADGAVSCWGGNRAGEIGNSTTRSDNPTVSRPEKVVDLPPASAVVLGRMSSCALTEDGRVYCWGDRNLGTPEEDVDVYVPHSEPRPYMIDGLPDIEQVAMFESHACALDGDGDVWCWGHNKNGEVGDGTTEARWTPVKVDGIPKMTELTTHHAITCALATNGRVWCWGTNAFGQLGRGLDRDELAYSAEPRPVRELRGVVSVDIGWRHACALMRDRKVKCWGDNTYGALGELDGLDDPNGTHTLPIEAPW